MISYKVQISTNCKKIILKFYVLSIVLGWMGTILPTSKGNNFYEKKISKCIILKLNQK
jgi:hypothetical protein